MYGSVAHSYFLCRTAGVDWCELAGVFERDETPPNAGTAAEELLPLPVLDALELLEPADMKSSGLFMCKSTPGPEKGKIQVARNIALPPSVGCHISYPSLRNSSLIMFNKVCDVSLIKLLLQIMRECR